MMNVRIQIPSYHIKQNTQIHIYTPLETKDSNMKYNTKDMNSKIQTYSRGCDTLRQVKH